MKHQEMWYKSDGGQTKINAYTLGRSLRGNPDAGLFIGELLTTVVNGGRPRPSEIGGQILQDHPTLQQMTIGMLMRVIEHIGRQDKIHTDARNEASIGACRKFAQMVDGDEITTHYPLI